MKGEVRQMPAVTFISLVFLSSPNRKGSGRYQQDQGAVKGEEWKEQRTVNSPALGDSFQMER